jgi:catechol 2,3-dioxygenase-like lactoylglutathione lyase family enzyme
MAASPCSETGVQMSSWFSWFQARFIVRHVTAVAILVVSAVAQTPVPNPLLGQGWGVDHVGVGVRDLSKAQHDYEQLGFKVSQGGHFPGGLFNSIISFENKTYLELLSIKGPQGNSPSQGDAAEIADFVKKHEGAMFLGLNVSSAKVAASYLKTQNFDVEGPDPGSIMKEGETKPPPPQWYSVSTADKPAPNKLGFSVPIFLIEYLSTDWYDKAHKEGWMEHPNTAIGIHAVWFAVHDLKSQLRTLRNAGFEADESRDVQLLGARGRELKAGSGTMNLLESSDKSIVLQKYLSDHDEGIIALSVEVSDLSKAQRMAESVRSSKIDIYKGTYGQSLLLSPDITHGVWLEMFQSR